jgi:hypothetical protein
MTAGASDDVKASLTERPRPYAVLMHEPMFLLGR